MELRIFLTSFFVSIVVLCTCAQEKRYDIRIRFPQSVNLSGLLVTTDDGSFAKEELLSYNKNTAILTGKYCSRYLVLRFSYPLRKSLFSSKTFFIDQEHTSVFFTDSISKDILSTFKTVNAVELQQLNGARELKAFVAREEKVVDNFLSEKRDRLEEEDSLWDVFNTLDSKLTDKKLEFIKLNGSLYYSFWVFKDEVAAGPDGSNQDTLLSVFDKTFPEKIRESFEGREVRKLLEGRTLKKNAPAPDFTSKTYDGKPVKLSDMKGRFVVLDFWASWCGPCLELMPEIKRVRDKFPAEQVEIISVSRDKDTAAFLKAIRKQGMSWLNILADPNVSKSYGGRVIPDVYIIDRAGNIIYRGQTDDKVDYVTFLEAEMNKPVSAARL